MRGALRSALVVVLGVALAFGEVTAALEIEPTLHAAQARPRKSRARTTPLQIDCLVDGADIYIDGDRVGVTPMEEPVRVEAGERVIRVVKRGYADFYDTVDVPRSRRTFHVEADLLPVAGILRLDSVPDGARVTLAGVYLGDTPFDGDIAEGQQTLLVVLQGFKNYELDLDVAGGERYELEIALEPLPLIDPFYTKWWFWTGVVAVTAGTVLAIVLATSDDGSPEPKNPVIRLPLGTW